MEPVTKRRNVVGAEAVLRFIGGIVLIVVAFFISGFVRWVLGLVGVVLILTALFGY